jgi:hypothetical protein
MDLIRDLRGEILAHLPYDKNNATAIAELSAMRESDLLILFLNWRSRLIHPHPREVYISNEIQRNPAFDQYRQDIGQL